MKAVVAAPLGKHRCDSARCSNCWLVAMPSATVSCRPATSRCLASSRVRPCATSLAIIES
jgi:hypothetical protein